LKKLNPGDNITNDRTEGTSDSSGNPSVNVFPDFSIPIANIKALGLSDAESPRVPYILSKVSYQYLHQIGIILRLMENVSKHNCVINDFIKPNVLFYEKGYIT
jgi:hypothetical protein